MCQFLLDRKQSAFALLIIALTLLSQGNASAQTGPIKYSLHTVSLGVSNAKGQQYVPGPKQNATAVDAFWVKQVGKMYDKVFHQRLLNEEGTCAAFLAALDRVYDESHFGDTAAIYLCGHGGGVKEAGQWLFSAYDGDVTESELRAKITRLARKGVKVLLILDSCHSGAVEIREPNVIVIASCGAEEVAHAAEDDGEHSLSLYTRILLEGIEGAADSNHDGVVTLVELDAYVANRIEAEILAAQRQGKGLNMQRPTCGRPTNLPSSLPLASVGGSPATPAPLPAPKTGPLP